LIGKNANGPITGTTNLFSQQKPYNEWRLIKRTKKFKLPQSYNKSKIYKIEHTLRSHKVLFGLKFT